MHPGSGGVAQLPGVIDCLGRVPVWEYEILSGQF
jgi:phosphoribosylcarboxyaminoimidazole (NCAIR) mutase